MLVNEHIEILYNLYGMCVIDCKLPTLSFFEKLIGISINEEIYYSDWTMFERTTPMTFVLFEHVPSNEITFYNYCIKLNITNEMIVKFALEMI